MRGCRWALLCGCALAGCSAIPSANAETVSYSYDALGRLRASSVSGGPDNGTNTAICYDAASNRERYVTTVAGAAVCTPSTYPQTAPLSSSSSSPAPSTSPAQSGSAPSR